MRKNTFNFQIFAFILVMMALTSCSSLYYQKNNQFQAPEFAHLNDSDTISVLLVQYADISESKRFMDTLYALCETQTSLKTIRSEMITSQLIKEKILSLPKNMNKSVIELIKPKVPSKYLFVVNIEDWKEAEWDKSNENTREGKLQMQFSLYDVNSLQLLYSVSSTMYISLPDMNSSLPFADEHSFDRTSIQLVLDTFRKELLKVFPKKDM